MQITGFSHRLKRHLELPRLELALTLHPHESRWHALFHASGFALFSWQGCLILISN